MSDLIDYKQFAQIADCDVSALYARKRRDAARFPKERDRVGDGCGRMCVLFDREEAVKYIKTYPIDKKKDNKPTWPVSEFNELAVAFIRGKLS